jgi:hypothetical protein
MNLSVEPGGPLKMSYHQLYEEDLPSFRSSDPDKEQCAAMLTVAVQEYIADVRPVFGKPRSTEEIRATIERTNP